LLRLLALHLLGLGLDAGELFVQSRIGLGLDAGDFRLQRARRRLFGLRSGFDLGAFAQQLDFFLRVLVRAARFGRFLAQPLELGEQARL
jgi:hypothetical protein